MIKVLVGDVYPHRVERPSEGKLRLCALVVDGLDAGDDHVLGGLCSGEAARVVAESCFK